MTTIKGKYEVDDNVITFYGDNNRIYTFARRGGDWGSVGVGEYTYMGIKLTQEYFNAHKDACTKSGTWEIHEGGWN